MAINNITVSGNVGKDCEIRVTQNDKSIASFTIAVSQGYGERKRTSWLKCVMFGGMATGLSSYIKKGDLVTVSGEYVTEEWEGNNGKVLQPTIIVNQIQLGKSSNQPPQTKTKSNQETTSYEFDDDIPF